MCKKCSGIIFIVLMYFVFCCECRAEEQIPLLKKGTTQVEIESQEVIISTDGTMHDRKGNWLYYKEDWYKYVDGIVEAFFPEISIVMAQYKVDSESTTLKNLRKELNLTKPQIIMVKEIVEISAEIRQLGENASRLETKVWGYEEGSDVYKDIPKERYMGWKNGLEKCYKGTAENNLILKRKARKFLKTLNENKRNKFFSWKEKKREEYKKREQAEWKKH